MPAENERLIDDRPDTIGSPLDQKIETKVSNTVFFSVIGGMSMVAIFIFGILFAQNSNLTAKVSTLEKDSAVIQNMLPIKKR